MTDRNKNYFAAFRTQKLAEDGGGLPEGLIVRPARMQDSLQLATLHQEREGGSLERQQERFQKEISENPDWQHRLLLVAESGGTLRGFARVIYFEPPSASPANMAPAGWYLAGLIVTPAFRRCGIGAELTRQRLEWIAAKADEAFYFVNAQNRASIVLHSGFSFEEVTRDFIYPGVSFTGGVGILYRITLHDRKSISPKSPSLSP